MHMPGWTYIQRPLGETVGPLIAEAEVAIEAGELERAGSLARKALAAEPGQVDALEILVGVHLGGEDFGAARDCLLQAMMLCPEHGDSLAHELTIVDEILNDLPKREWRTEDIEELVGKADSAFERGWIRTGTKLTEIGKRLSPQDPGIRFLEGRLAQLGEAWHEAEAHYSAALEAQLSTDNGQGANAARHQLAFVLMRQEKFSAAARHYEAFVQQRPRSPAAWNNLGVCFLKLGRRREALRCFEKSVRVEPEYYMGWVAMAQLLGPMGRVREAERCLRKAFRINPAYTIHAMEASLRPHGVMPVHRTGMADAGQAEA
ncbi:MAG: tetratricopeptide repeat protein [Euryarchaeota archaeon]|nr:tetratricopeptide repeat protein [Euryarchaeota archaeon]